MSDTFISYIKMVRSTGVLYFMTFQVLVLSELQFLEIKILV